MWMGPPKALDWPNPMSSMRTISTLGAPAGAFTSNRGGGVALRTSNTVLCGYCGSGIGSTERSVGSTTFAGTACWALTGIAQDATKESVKIVKANRFMSYLRRNIRENAKRNAFRRSNTRRT